MNHKDFLFKSKQELEIVENMLAKQDKIVQAKIISDLCKIHHFRNKETMEITIARWLHHDLKNYEFFSGFNEEHIEDFPQYCGSPYKLYIVICTDGYDSRLEDDESMMEKMYGALCKYGNPDVWGECLGVSGINNALNIYGVLSSSRHNFGFESS